jgi:hypothetical protein
MALQASQLHQPNPSTSERACIVGTTQNQPLPTTCPPTILLQLTNARHHTGRKNTSQPAERACEQPGSAYHHREWRKKQVHHQPASREGMRAAWQRLSPGMENKTNTPEQGGAHSRRLHPSEAARPALMSRAAHAVESKAVVHIEVAVQPTPLPGLRCGARLARRASPPRRPTPVVRSEGAGGGAHPPACAF